MVILVGMITLGVREYTRTGGTFAARWDQVKFTILAASMILLGVTAAVLAVLYIIAVVVVEIWQPLLIIAAVIGGLIASYIWVSRSRR